MQPHADPKTAAEMARNRATVRERLWPVHHQIVAVPTVVTPLEPPVIVTDDSEDMPLNPKIKFPTIVREVIAKYKVSWIDIVSPRRTANLTRPRFEIMWRAKQETLLSLPQIGQRMSRDHTSVLSGIRRYQALLDAGKVSP